VGIKVPHILWNFRLIERVFLNKEFSLCNIKIFLSQPADVPEKEHYTLQRFRRVTAFLPLLVSVNLCRKQGMTLKLGLTCRDNVNVKVILRPTISLPVCIGVCHSSGTGAQFFFLSFYLFLDIYGLVDVGSTLWREVGSVVFSRCWAPPMQSFSDQSPAELVTIFHCLNSRDFPKLENQFLYFPQEQGSPVIPPDNVFM
jgi:hypothetical protein